MYQGGGNYRNVNFEGRVCKTVTYPDTITSSWCTIHMLALCCHGYHSQLFPSLLVLPSPHYNSPYPKEEAVSWQHTSWKPSFQYEEIMAQGNRKHRYTGISHIGRYWLSNISKSISMFCLTTYHNVYCWCMAVKIEDVLFVCMYTSVQWLTFQS